MPHNHLHICGKCCPSVTEILAVKPKPFLDKWRERHGERLCSRKLGLSNKIGTEFHRCVEIQMGGGTPDPKCPRVEKMLKSFNVWFDGHAIAPHALELKVYSRKHLYQGTLDFLGEIDKNLEIADYKTTDKIYDDMALQLVAYARAYEEMTGIKINEGRIIAVSKRKPNFKLREKVFKLSNSLFKEFLNLRSLYVPKPCKETEVIEIA